MALITYNVSVLALFENDEFTYPYWPDTDTRIRIGAFELLSTGKLLFFVKCSFLELGSLFHNFLQLRIITALVSRFNGQTEETTAHSGNPINNWSQTIQKPTCFTS